MNTDVFTCEFCEAEFNKKFLLVRHLKSSKRCIEKRPKTLIKCIWCEEGFASNMALNNHKCTANKDFVCTTLRGRLETCEKMIKDLQDKLAEKSSTTTINTTTNNNTTTNYNIILKCAKPLVLTKERIENLITTTFTKELVIQGAYGLAKWFVKEVCVNEKGEIAIQCTDTSRLTFKYIDKNDELTKISGGEILEMIKEVIPSFKKTPIYLEIYQKSLDEYGVTNLSILVEEVIRPDEKCIKYMSLLTTKNKIVSLLTKNKDNIDSILDKDITVENKLETYKDEE